MVLPTGRDFPPTGLGSLLPKKGVASPAITAWLLGESVETQLALISPYADLCPSAL